MKELYKSPVITVEDLTKADVLCASTETCFNRNIERRYNTEG